MYCIYCGSPVKEKDNFCGSCGARLHSIQVEHTNSEQTLYFKNGKLYNVIGGNKNNWYDARFLISDGIHYDLDSAESISAISIPRFSALDVEGYGVTGSLDYVLRMKAGACYNNGKFSLCSACLWKSSELMLANKNGGWRYKDFRRLVDWHNQMKMFSEAEKAKQWLSANNVLDVNTFDSMAKTNIARVLKLSKLWRCDLVVCNDVGGGCCNKCAPLRGRVYSLSGKSRKYPPLPPYVKENGNFHPGCRCSINLYVEDGAKIMYKGKFVDPVKASHRPWKDDRTSQEKRNYEEYKKVVRAEIIKDMDRDEYYILVSLMPDMAPKSFGAYRKMKNAKSENFLKIVEAAKSYGIVINLE